MAKRRKKEDIASRIALAVALVLMIYALSNDSFQTLVFQAPTMLGSAVIGMSAGVEANPYNTLAAQLSEKERELAAREARLQDAADGGLYDMGGTRMLSAASFMLSLALFVLVALNYFFDWRRSKMRTA